MLKIRFTDRKETNNFSQNLIFNSLKVLLCGKMSQSVVKAMNGCSVLEPSLGIVVPPSSFFR
jgi:hypothetical protein